MKQRALIIGENPIKKELVRQFANAGYDIELMADDPMTDSAYNNYKDIVILSSVCAMDALAEDNRVIELMLEIAGSCSAEVRTRIHLLLQNQESLWMLNARDYKDEQHQRVEINAFTMEDVWAKNILVSTPTNPVRWGLDYTPISFESNQTVHLVVLGASGQTETLVRNASLVAHYPNYVRNHQLRTRITIIDGEMDVWQKSFISRLQSLMDNSYYRYIDVEQKYSETHKPMYEGKREDFVDVEWEFVKGDVYNLVVQDKLQTWAEDEGQVLSVAVCNENDVENITQMRMVADMLQGQQVPIYVRQKDSTLVDLMCKSLRFAYVVPFGMLDRGYDIGLPLLQMAKRVKYVYDYCYDYNMSNPDGRITAPSYIDEEVIETGWLGEKKAVKRYSSLCNAMTLATKMRSLGHKEDNWQTFYAISQKETTMIAQVEHNRWNVEELLLGFRPCTDEEQQEVEDDISKKAYYKDRLVHYDLRAYSDLRVDDTGKNVDTYDLCLSASIPLIAYSATRKEGGDV